MTPESPTTMPSSDEDQGRRSIGRLLCVIGAVVSAGILLLSFFLTFRLSSEEAIVEDMQGVIEAVSNETVAHTASFLAPAERSVQELTNFVERDGSTDVSSLPLQQFFFGLLEINETFEGIFIGRDDGSFEYVFRNEIGGYTVQDISTTDGERIVENTEFGPDNAIVATGFDPTNSYDPRSRPWFNLAVDADDGQGVWTAPYVFSGSPRTGVTRAQALTLANGEQVVVGIDIRIDDLSTFMSERRASLNGSSFIVDREMNVVAHPDQRRVLESAGLAQTTDLDAPPLTFVSDLIRTGAGGEATELTSGSVDGQDYQFAITSLPNNPEWIVAVTAPNEDFLARVRGEQRTLRSISALGGVISVLVLIFGGLVVNRRYRRERELAETALVAAEDLAEERDATRARLVTTVDELARSNADLEEYAYATAHDLRTPLRAMGGYAELMVREAEEQSVPPELSEYAERIVEGYERMCRTMDKLLDHARSGLDAPVVEAVSINPIADEVVEDFDERIRSSDTQVTIGKLGKAAVDPIAMSRIFQNLICNALRSKDPDRPLLIDISSEREGPFVCIQVRDTGVGIDAKDHEAIFRLFTRLFTDDEGSGMGLALVKKLVEEHDGTIDLTSTVGVGSTFTIRMPTEPSLESNTEMVYA